MLNFKLNSPQISFRTPSYMGLSLGCYPVTCVIKQYFALNFVRIKTEQELNLVTHLLGIC